jgi:hypothetical protein
MHDRAERRCGDDADQDSYEAGDQMAMRRSGLARWVLSL